MDEVSECVWGECVSVDEVSECVWGECKHGRGE